MTLLQQILQLFRLNAFTYSFSLTNNTTVTSQLLPHVNLGIDTAISIVNALCSVVFEKVTNGDKAQKGDVSKLASGLIYYKNSYR